MTFFSPKYNLNFRAKFPTSVGNNNAKTQLHVSNKSFKNVPYQKTCFFKNNNIMMLETTAMTSKILMPIRKAH